KGCVDRSDGTKPYGRSTRTKSVRHDEVGLDELKVGKRRGRRTRAKRIELDELNRAVGRGVDLVELPCVLAMGNPVNGKGKSNQKRNPGDALHTAPPTHIATAPGPVGSSATEPWRNIRSRTACDAV